MRFPFKNLISILLFLSIFLIESPSEAENLSKFDLAEKNFIISQGNTLSPIFSPKERKILKVKGIVTAYSSTPSQTDNTPFLTASGKKVRDGIVANNLFPFGTKIKIPDIFRDKIFVVEDRMKKGKWKYHFDVWFEDHFEALNFGKKETLVEILINE
jgi:3D (Asp-Asp-Asp) domain-containing protein